MRARVVLAALALALALMLGLPALLAGRHQAPPASDNPQVTLSLGAGRPTLTLPLETYLVGVVGAEMPADFLPAALEAQAVAARTYTVAHIRARSGGGCSDDPRADVCVGPQQGQAWRSQAELRRSWGASYNADLARVAGAVAATRGQVLTYAGRPIDAVYSAASGGETEDARFVWGRAVPYLIARPVPFESPSPYDLVTTTVSSAELARRLGIPPAQVGLDVLQRDPQGRVLEARVGPLVLSGKELRDRLGLPSTWLVAWRQQAGRFLLTTRGYGHGVGLSQWGAQGMAKRGAGFAAILAYFYPGTRLEPLHTLASSGKTEG